MSTSSGGVPGPLELSILNAIGRAGLAQHEAGAALSSAGTGGTHGAGGAGRTVGLEPASPDLLARAGLASLRDALARGDDRAAAFDLLTADALITKACEAAVTGDLPESLSAAHFVTLLEGSA